MEMGLNGGKTRVLVSYEGVGWLGPTFPMGSCWAWGSSSGGNVLGEAGGHQGWLGRALGSWQARHSGPPAAACCQLGLGWKHPTEGMGVGKQRFPP